MTFGTRAAIMLGKLDALVMLTKLNSIMLHVGQLQGREQTSNKTAQKTGGLMISHRPQPQSEGQ